MRVLHERDEFLDEERIPAAAVEEKRNRLVVGVAAHQLANELRGRELVERIETQHERVVATGIGRPARTRVRDERWR